MVVQDEVHVQLSLLQWHLTEKINKGFGPTFHWWEFEVELYPHFCTHQKSQTGSSAACLEASSSHVSGLSTYPCWFT